MANGFPEKVQIQPHDMRHVVRSDGSEFPLQPRSGNCYVPMDSELITNDNKLLKGNRIWTQEFATREFDFLWAYRSHLSLEKISPATEAAKKANEKVSSSDVCLSDDSGKSAQKIADLRFRLSQVIDDHPNVRYSHSGTILSDILWNQGHHSNACPYSIETIIVRQFWQSSPIGSYAKSSDFENRFSQKSESIFHDVHADLTGRVSKFPQIEEWHYKLAKWIDSSIKPQIPRRESRSLSGRMRSSGSRELTAFVKRSCPKLDAQSISGRLRWIRLS
jgi:hypothetical protein